MSPSNDDVALISAVGMDYTTLRNLLAAGKWREADMETARVMLKVAGREEEGWLDDENINNFPCEDLRTIDQLWVKYSNGRFGFSVQKRIWMECGGQPGKWNYEVYKKYGDRVGWRMKDEWIYYDELTFKLNAPQAHLPLMEEGGSWNVWVEWGGVGRLKLFCGVSFLASRLVNCNI